MKRKHHVVHYDDMQVFGGINLCGVRGTWHGTSEVLQVTCKNCQKRLTYWLVRNGVLKQLPKLRPLLGGNSTHFAGKKERLRG